MVTSKQLPTQTTATRPKRRGLGGAGIMFFLMIVLAGALSLGAVGLFAPSRLALVQEQTLGLLHGGIAATDETTYVDGCVSVEGQEGPRAVTRTRRTVIFRDGTTLEVVFSGTPAPTNACG